MTDDFVTGAVDGAQNGVTPCEIDVTDIDLYFDAAGNAVHCSGKDVAHTDRRNGIDRAGGLCGRFDRKGDLSGCEECVMPLRHEHRAGMSSFSLDPNSQTRRRGNGGDNANGNIARLEDRTLLNMQLEKRCVIISRQTHVVQRTHEAGRRAHLIERLAILVDQASSAFHRQTSRKQAAAQAADTKPRRLFRSEHHEFDRAPRLIATALQRANRLEPTENTNRSVVSSRIGNRIRVGTCADGREIGFQTRPARECISDSVFSNGQAGGGAKLLEIGASRHMRF